MIYALKVRLLLFVLAFAFIELFLLVVLTTETSIWVTMGIVLGTALLGSILARYQGANVLRSAMSRLAQGQSPGHDLMHGVLIFTASSFLIWPGLIGDVIGLCLLLPVTRRFLITLVLRSIGKRTGFAAFANQWSQFSHWEQRSGYTTENRYESNHENRDYQNDDPDIIDAEFRPAVTDHLEGPETERKT